MYFMSKKIAVIAFNEAQSELYRLLLKKGCSCEKVNLISSAFVKEYMKAFDTLVLPFPSKRENLSAMGESEVNLGKVLSESQLVIGGMLDKDIKNELENAGIAYRDYFEDEAYVLRNAFITAQGVLRLLLENTRGMLSGKTALVTGFGRIGKALSLELRSLGLKVYVAARSRTQLTEAASFGFDALEISGLKGALFYFDFIFNTVPFRIFDKKAVGYMRENGTYFEIASSPFGADRKDFCEDKIKYVSASALPGKYYPEAVAENVADYILSLERGDG